MVSSQQTSLSLLLLECGDRVQNGNNGVLMGLTMIGGQILHLNPVELWAVLTLLEAASGIPDGN